jgi:hypothetical protein
VICPSKEVSLFSSFTSGKSASGWAKQKYVFIYLWVFDDAAVVLDCIA